MMKGWQIPEFLCFLVFFFLGGGAVKHKAQNKKYVPICPNPGVILGIQCLLVLCLTKMRDKKPQHLRPPDFSMIKSEHWRLNDSWLAWPVRWHLQFFHGRIWKNAMIQRAVFRKTPSKLWWLMVVSLQAPEAAAAGVSPMTPGNSVEKNQWVWMVCVL